MPVRPTKRLTRDFGRRWPCWMMWSPIEPCKPWSLRGESSFPPSRPPSLCLSFSLPPSAYPSPLTTPSHPSLLCLALVFTCYITQFSALPPSLPLPPSFFLSSQHCRPRRPRALYSLHHRRLVQPHMRTSLGNRQGTSLSPSLASLPPSSIFAQINFSFPPFPPAERDLL